MSERGASVSRNISSWGITVPAIDVEDQGATTSFAIEVNPGRNYRAWRVIKRYSEIRAIWDTLQYYRDAIPVVVGLFSSSYLFRCSGHILEARRSGLETSLQFLTARSEPRFAGELLQFLTHSRAFLTETRAIFEDLVSDQVFRIEKTEERGITFLQIQAIMKHVHRRCEIEVWESTQEGNPVNLTPSSANLYDVVHHVINPATQFQQCSFVELVACGVQTPKYFISHWWGEAVADFVSCLERHLKVRGNHITTPYWVCAYANNQHQLGTDLGNDPRDSSFYKAMRLSLGVLLILDGQATPFRRIWCCFEEAVVVLSAADGLNHCLQRPLLLDIATVSNDGPQLLTDGLTDEEKDVDQLLQERNYSELRASYPEFCERFKGREDALSGWRLKAEREAAFPLDVICPSCDIVIAEADASHHLDKVKILNALASRPASELESEVDLGLPIYSTIDYKLRGIFGTGPAVWRQAISRGIDISGPTARLPLLRTLQEDTERTEFTLILSAVENAKDFHVQMIGDSFVHLKQLRVLHLNFAKTPITSIHELSKGLRHLGSLDTLKLEFAFCTSLTTLGELGTGLASLSCLKRLHLDFQDCHELTTVSEFGQGLAALHNLTFLHLDLSGCNNLRTVEAIGNGLQHIHELQELTLGFDFCEGLTSISEIANAMVKLQNLMVVRLQVAGTTQMIADQIGCSLGTLCGHSLTALRLDMWNCEKITNIDEIGRGLANINALHDLRIDFDGCCGIDTIDEVAYSLGHLDNLTTVTLSLGECSSLSSVRELATALTNLSHLSKLNLNFDRCPKILDFCEIGKSLSRLDSIVDLKLNFRVCAGLVTLCEVGRGLANLVNLAYLQVDCEFCAELTSAMEVGNGLAHLTQLAKVEINFRGCMKLCTVDVHDKPLRHRKVGLTCDGLLASLPWRDP